MRPRSKRLDFYLSETSVPPRLLAIVVKHGFATLGVYHLVRAFLTRNMNPSAPLQDIELEIGINNDGLTALKELISARIFHVSKDGNLSSPDDSEMIDSLVERRSRDRSRKQPAQVTSTELHVSKKTEEVAPKEIEPKIDEAQEEMINKFLMGAV